MPAAADTSSATTPLSDASALQVSASSSGSVKNRVRASVSASSLKSVRAGIVSDTSGGRFGTVTAKRCSAVSPSSSVAVTVTSTSPLASAVTTTALPVTSADTNALSDTAAAYESESPSGSVKKGETSNVSAWSTSMIRAAIESTGTGGRLGTVTTKLWVAERPPGSVAVTVTTTSPFATAAMVNTAPSTLAARRLESDTATAYPSPCPSGSLKYPDTSRVAESPTINSRSAIVPTVVGGRFGTTTRKLCCAFRPVGSVAIIVTSATPGETAVTVTVLPAATAVATPGSELTTL